MGWEHLPGMGQSLTWFMECRCLFAWDGSSNIGFLWLTSLDNANKSAGFLRTCVDFLRASAVETLTFYVLSVCKYSFFVI